MAPSPALLLNKENSPLPVPVKYWDGGHGGRWDGSGTGDWLQKQQQSIRGLSSLQATSLCLPLTLLQLQWPPWSSCNLPEVLPPQSLSTLPAMLVPNCLHPLVLPPDSLITLVNIWHITCSICLLFISPQKCQFHKNWHLMSVWWLFSLSSAVFQCLEQCLEHRKRLNNGLLNELKKIGKGRDSKRSYFKVSLSRIPQENWSQMH